MNNFAAVRKMYFKEEMLEKGNYFLTLLEQLLTSRILAGIYHKIRSIPENELRKIIANFFHRYWPVFFFLKIALSTLLN